MREEKKFSLPSVYINDILCLLRKNGNIDDHCAEKGFYYVETQYLLIWKDKTKKGKIRLRKYTSGESIKYFLENKYKVDKIGDKIRFEINEQQYYELRNYNIKDILNFIVKLSPEIIFFTENIESEIVLSSIKLSYKRYAYEVKINNHEYRITVDCDLALNYDNSLVNLINSDNCILEIKGKHDIDSVINLLSPYIKQRLKKSKYGAAKEFLADLTGNRT